MELISTMTDDFRPRRTITLRWFRQALTTPLTETRPKWQRRLLEDWGADWTELIFAPDPANAMLEFLNTPYDCHQWRNWQHDFLHTLGVADGQISTEVITQLKLLIEPLEDTNPSAAVSEGRLVTKFQEKLQHLLAHCESLDNNPYCLLLHALLHWSINTQNNLR